MISTYKHQNALLSALLHCLLLLNKNYINTSIIMNSPSPLTAHLIKKIHLSSSDIVMSALSQVANGLCGKRIGKGNCHIVDDVNIYYSAKFELCSRRGSGKGSREHFAENLFPLREYKMYTSELSVLEF